LTLAPRFPSAALHSSLVMLRSITSATAVLLVHASGVGPTPACAPDASGACSAEDVENVQLLQHVASRDADRHQRKLVPALIDAVYTYGAPATHNQPFRNAATEDECFPGLRSYNENLLGVHNEIHQVDAAAMNNFYPHAYTNSVVLHWDKDSYYSPCRAHKEFGHPEWPQRGWGVFQEWRIHHEADYTDRLNALTVDGEKVAEEEPFKSARLFVILAFKSYENVQSIKSALADKMPGWNLVAREVYETYNDQDPVMVVQDSKSLDCAFVFTGTNNFADLPSSTTSYGTGYCGFDGVHVGYRNELWWLTKSLWPSLRPKLEHCNKVTCVGHSLGGSLCELFAACANSGNYTHEDYKLLQWTKKTPWSLPELDED